MNFSDFGVKDESELEQDNFSLSRPTFGKGNQLTVIGWKGRYSTGHKIYIVKCSECSKDPELFGDGVFRASKERARGSHTPCGCSSCTKWTKDQYELLIKRKCKEYKYSYEGIVGEYKKHPTKIKLLCNKHNTIHIITLGEFLCHGGGCPLCGIDSLRLYISKSDDFYRNKFMSSGVFKEGTKFWKLNKLDKNNIRSYWNYTCPICSNDEYVQNGLCSGVFEGHVSNLSVGRISCRCSPSYRWTKEQYEYRIKKRMQESNTTDEFISFIGEFNGVLTEFIRDCREHGEYLTKINSYLSNNSGCPLCANQNQQQAYINLVKDEENIVALKFGIAKDSKLRIRDQNNKTILNVEQYGVWSFPDVKSCKAAEKFIKQNLKCKILTKDQMPDGYTETTSIENIEAIIKIYEDFGGVRKFISDG